VCATTRARSNACVWVCEGEDDDDNDDDDADDGESYAC
jgi:hypothetical protein